MHEELTETYRAVAESMREAGMSCEFVPEWVLSAYPYEAVPAVASVYPEEKVLEHFDAVGAPRPRNRFRLPLHTVYLP